MDSDSNERFFDRMEDDSDPENDPYFNKKKSKTHHWTPENTYKLIQLWKKECKELWDPKHPFYKFRTKRVEKQEFLANQFGTTTDEINRKLHNLRSQYNNELRKIKKKRLSGAPGGAAGATEDVCSWEYFETLSFLVPATTPTTTIDSDISSDPLEINVALAEFQAKEEEEFKIEVNEPSSSQLINKRLPTSRVPPVAPMPLPPHAHPMFWPEEPIPRSNSSVNVPDECQIFGDFVASELRSLKSIDARKRLKRIIQKAILHVGEDEDVAMMSG